MILATDKALQQSTSVFKQISNAIFTSNSLWILVGSLVVASLAGKILSLILRKLSRTFGHRADAASDIRTVNQFRRLETWTILSIAIVRLLCFVLALYFWWALTHPHNRPSALVGASALLVVIVGGVFSPLLRDLAFGSGMMAEHWFGVGDLVTLEPGAIQGVVERITLRSTRIRGLNGEVIWITNQNIWSARIAQKGVWSMAIEMFVTDPKRAEKLVAQTNALLPTGPSLVASRLDVIATDQRSEDVWHITAIGETAPGREWLLERTAVELLIKLDERSGKPILLTDPVPRYADNDTERQFARAVRNAKKTRRSPRRQKTETTQKNPTSSH